LLFEFDEQPKELGHFVTIRLRLTRLLWLNGLTGLAVLAHGRFLLRSQGKLKDPTKAKGPSPFLGDGPLGIG